MTEQVKPREQDQKEEITQSDRPDRQAEQKPVEPKEGEKVPDAPGETEADPSQVP